VVGPLEANCYVFADEATKEAAIIDPGGEPSAIQKYLKDNALKPRCVINTHGHGDHIGANHFFAKESGVSLLIHEDDADFLNSPKLNLSSAFGMIIKAPPATRLLKDRDRIDVGKLYLEVLHTPGHTPGGICLRYNGAVFTGDTLFYEGIGRTDLPNSSEEAILASIRNKLMVLPDECLVYPGHGPETSIGHERRHNPFL
jgi:glyoxylase-like metal-dependent hydrolase (beta-lactamase superfamily II)